MLRKRLTEPRRIVSMYDPAMKQIDMQRRLLYQSTRNIEDLGDISALSEPFTICTVAALLPRHQHLQGFPYLLFAKYCSKIENAHFTESAFEENDGWVSMKKEFAEELGSDDVVDMAGAILQMASVDGTVSPFSLADTAWQDRIREAERQAALRAVIGPAKKPPSKPSTSQSEQPETKPEPGGRSTPST